jgi:hypothetical protein
MSLRLYEYPEAYRELWARIEAEAEGLADTDENPVAAGRGEFDALEGDYSDKVENIGKLIQSLRATCDALDTESARLKARAASIKRKIDWLKSYVVDSMRELGRDKIEGGVLIVSLTRNQRVELSDLEPVPSRFVTVVEEQKIDKAGIRQALKDGEDVPGARLVDTHSIKIR